MDIPLENEEIIEESEKKVFEKFEVYKKEDAYSFIHINISDKNFFLKKLSEYILDENNILQYIENKTDIRFSPLKEHYVKLYKRLELFIDEENVELIIDDDEIGNILIDENSLIDKSDSQNKIKIRLSKVGRFGEYLSHLILSQYFKFTCIIPKVSLTTNRNMSVFGIDELFLCKDTKMILFGESKISKNLENGIKLINESLKKYEHQIKEEFKLIISNGQIKKNGLEEIFGNIHELCINFEEFLNKTETKAIGIPLFIAHGEETKYKEIINNLISKINKKQFFGLETQYYIISLPIINKNELLAFFTLEIKKKLEEYKNATQMQ